jgi:heme oxygenase
MTTIAAPLSVRLAQATRASHRAAERAGFMPSLLRGEIATSTYVLLLRNLHALYAALERALETRAAARTLAPMRTRAFFRADTLALDLGHLAPRWSELPVTLAMQAYVARIEAVTRTQPGLLAAHAYVRYMGDLSGGQVLRDIVRRALALVDGRGTAFYDFGEESPDALKAEFRRGLDALVLPDDEMDAIVAEAGDAFARHVALFEELSVHGAADGPNREA